MTRVLEKWDSVGKNLLVSVVSYEQLSITCIIVLLYVMCPFISGCFSHFLFNFVFQFGFEVPLGFSSYFSCLRGCAACFPGYFHLLCLHVSAPFHSLPSPPMTPITCVLDHFIFPHSSTKGLFTFFIFSSCCLDWVISIEISVNWPLQFNYSFSCELYLKLPFFAFIFGGYCYET